jgi:hypothetical protein
MWTFFNHETLDFLEIMDRLEGIEPAKLPVNKVLLHIEVPP